MIIHIYCLFISNDIDKSKDNIYACIDPPNNNSII